MRVISAMHDGNSAIYAETTATEGEHNADLMITPKPYTSFTMGEHAVFKSTGEYDNVNLGDVVLGTSTAIQETDNMTAAHVADTYSFSADWTK